MGVGYNPKIVTNSLLLSLDFSSLKNYVSGTSANASVSDNTFTFYNGATYNTVANGILTTTRSATLVNKATDGGGLSTTGSGNLTVANFLYNNFTWEVWFKINDRTASNYDATETLSAMAVYGGYHAGFTYNSTTMYFSVWDGLSTSKVAASWTLGASGSQINEGSWYQIAVTRSSDTFTPYINGSQLGTGSTSTTSSVGIGTSNRLCIGSAVTGGNYQWYSKASFANMKMYNSALSATEIQQNYNALRGRFGI